MNRPLRYAVIPTNNRECLTLCIQAIMPQVDKVILIETAEPSLNVHWKLDKLADPRRPVNISRWWNRGLRHASALARGAGAETWDVAVLNDDVVVPPSWFDDLSTALRSHPVAVASYSDQVLGRHLQTDKGQIPLWLRPQGFAWMIKGESDLRADERFHWYCTDDSIWQNSFEFGGYVLVPGTVNHMYPNGQVTGEIQELIAQDMQSYVDKYGFRPW